MPCMKVLGQAKGAFTWQKFAIFIAFSSLVLKEGKGIETLETNVYKFSDFGMFRSTL